MKKPTFTKDAYYQMLTQMTMPNPPQPAGNSVIDALKQAAKQVKK